MNIEDIGEIYNYSHWANARLMEVIEGLTPEEFTRRIGGAFDSIRTTLVHMLSAEWGWLARCGGPERGPRLDPEAFPTLASIKEAWKKAQQGRREFLRSMRHTDVRLVVTYYNDDGEARRLTLGEIMLHAANHNAHHRGQVSMMLRMLGRVPGDVDQLFYYRDKHGVPVW